jgi:hypothetical protein
MTQQHFSEIVTFPVLCNVGLPLSYENTGNITPAQYEVNSGPFEEENFAISSQDEEKPSPTETATIRSLQTLPFFRRAAQTKFSQQLCSKVYSYHYSLLLEVLFPL